MLKKIKKLILFCILPVIFQVSKNIKCSIESQNEKFIIFYINSCQELKYFLTDKCPFKKKQFISPIQIMNYNFFTFKSLTKFTRQEGDPIFVTTYTKKKEKDLHILATTINRKLKIFKTPNPSL